MDIAIYTDENNITFNSVKIPQTLFNEGPLGILRESGKGIHYNGNEVTSVFPFINAVDIDWNGLEIDEKSISTTGELISWIKNSKIESPILKKLDLQLLNTIKKESVITYDPIGKQWNFNDWDNNLQLIEITYLNLINLIVGNKLNPGKQYRIIDYTASVNIENTSVALNLLFDIIVTAISTNTLSEFAKATWHVGDSYFEKNNLPAWELKYSIFNGNYDSNSGEDNSGDEEDDIFSWTEGEKGVIYYLKDEFGNEAPYDFKNILFKYDDIYYYTFSYCIRNNVRDASLLSTCKNNIIKPLMDSLGKYYLNLNLFISTHDYTPSFSNILIESNCSHIVFLKECSNILIKSENSYLCFTKRYNNIIVLPDTSNSLLEITFDLHLTGTTYYIIGKKSSNTVFYLNILDFIGLPSLVELNTTSISGINLQLVSLNTRLNIYHLEPINYASLVALKTNGKLEIGKLYRINDYNTTINNALLELTSASVEINSTNYNIQKSISVDAKLFDIIVVADSETELNENARAIQHVPLESESLYFLNNNLSAWELKYSLLNDTNRFEWANSNGKGVIYYMKDEFNNECNYDFKNIKFSFRISKGEQEIESYSGLYTFSLTLTLSGTITVSDYSLNSECFNNKVITSGLSFNILLHNGEALGKLNRNTIINGQYNILKNCSSNNIENSSYNILDNSDYNIIKNNSSLNKLDNSDYNNFLSLNNNNELTNSNSNIFLNGNYNNILTGVTNSQILSNVYNSSLDNSYSGQTICSQTLTSIFSNEAENDEDGSGEEEPL